MAKYNFVRWEDEAEVIVSTTPSFTTPITSDKTFTAVYEIAMRTVTFQSTPISVEVMVDTTPIPAGGSIAVEDGATITFKAPSEVEA